MNNYFYIYNLVWYDKTSGNEEKSSGIAVGSSYSNALQGILEDWGEDNICKITLDCISDCENSIEFDELDSLRNLVEAGV